MSRYIAILALFLFFSPASEATSSDMLIDLTNADLYAREGFHSSWISYKPQHGSRDYERWLKIPKSSTNERAIKVMDLEFPILTKEESQLIKANNNYQKADVFTFITSFNLSEKRFSAENLIGLFMASIGDNWEVYLNGNLVRQEVFLNEDNLIVKHRLLRNVLIPLKQSFLIVGENTLAFKIIGNRKYEGTGFYNGSPYLVGDYVELLDQKTELSSFVLSFTYLIVGLFFIFMYLRRPKGLYNLLFGISCFLLFIYLVSRTSHIQNYIDNSVIIFKIEFISLYLFATTSIAFFDLVLGFKINKVVLLHGLLTFITVMLTLFGDAIFIDKVLRAWQYSVIFGLSYVLLYRVGRQIYLEAMKLTPIYSQHSLLMKYYLTSRKVFFSTIPGNLAIGTLIFGITSIFDVLNSINGGAASFGFKYGFFIFMIGNATVLISKFVKAQVDAENLSLNLEQKVAQRTKSLELANSQLAAARDEAKSSNKSKGEFLANMSHEIRTPINGIVGMITMLRDTQLNDQQKQYTSIAKYSAESLLSLINDILDFSKIEAGKMELESIPFNLKERLEKFVAMSKIEAKQKNLSFEWTLDSNIHQNLIGDPNRLKQILINLVSNAIKFTATGGIKLTVACDSNDKQQNDEIESIKFSIEDTGIGIPEDKKQNLFSKFTQVDKSNTRKYGGTGLGLAISKELVTEMDGKVGINSEVGKGSEFWFTISLPKQTDTKEAESEKINKELPKPKNYETKRVLIAEDNVVNQMVLKGMLNKFGFEINIVENGQLAINALEKTAYDLVFMDLQMPVLDGIEATKKIRAGEAGKSKQKTIILAVTANAMKGDAEKCLESGMNDYLSKPVMIDDLANALEKWIE